MTPTSRFATAVTLAFLPFLVRAEGKCGDDPKKLPTGELVVTWTLPVPAKADVATGVDDKVFSDLNRLIGPEYPGGLPQKVRSSITPAKHPVVDGETSPADPAKSKKASKQALIDWEHTYGIDLTANVAKAIEDHLADVTTLPDRFQMYASLVQHPPLLDEGVGYSLCTCALQRGVVMWEGSQETLYVRSTFHSEKPGVEWSNFQPKGVKVTFATKTLWFPLRLNRVLPDSRTPAFLVLDVLTPDSLPQIPDAAIKAIPWDLKDVTRGNITLGTKSWKYVRLRRMYQRGDDPAQVNDVALKAPGT